MNDDGLQGNLFQQAVDVQLAFNAEVEAYQAMCIQHQAERDTAFKALEAKWTLVAKLKAELAARGSGMPDLIADQEVHRIFEKPDPSRFAGDN